jgi:hypothetical protein
MNFSSADIATMRQALVDLRTQIEETGPCDHPVNICVCGLRNTYENLGDLFYRITDKQVGFPRQPEFIDLVEFSRKFLDPNAANAAFRNGTINHQ